MNPRLALQILVVVATATVQIYKMVKSAKKA